MVHRHGHGHGHTIASRAKQIKLVHNILLQQQQHQQQASLHSYHSAVDKFSMQLIFSIGTHTDRHAFILKTIHDDGTMCSYCMLSRVYHLLCRGCDTSAHSTWNIWFWFALLCFELIGWLWLSLWVSFFFFQKYFISFVFSSFSKCSLFVSFNCDFDCKGNIKWTK